MQISGHPQRVSRPHNASHAKDAPTPEEFEQARRRELARLDLRLDSVTGRAFHTPGDAELLKGDTADKRWSDTDVVHRWAAGSDERDARTGRAERRRARRDRVGG